MLSSPLNATSIFVHILRLFRIFTVRLHRVSIPKALTTLYKIVLQKAYKCLFEYVTNKQQLCHQNTANQQKEEVNYALGLATSKPRHAGVLVIGTVVLMFVCLLCLFSVILLCNFASIIYNLYFFSVWSQYVILDCCQSVRLYRVINASYLRLDK